MPMVIYDVPFIGASNKERQYSQKGPTCWYYATKMLFRFHELLNGRADQLYESWKALSELRKVLTMLGMENIKSVMTGGAYRADSILPHLTEANVGIARDIKKYEQEKEKLRRRITELSQEAKPLSGDIKQHAFLALAEYGEKIDKLKRRASALSVATQHVSKLRKECLLGNRFVNLFFNPPAFIGVPIPDGKSEWQRTELELYKVLSNYGPVYAGGDLGWASASRQGGDIEVAEIGGHANGHAVAVVGVDTYHHKVYYKDPNASNSVCVVDFKKFIAKVEFRQVGTELSLFAAVKCDRFDSHGTEYCEHVRLGKKKTAHLSRMVRQEEEMWDDVEWGAFGGAEAPLMLEWKPN